MSKKIPQNNYLWEIFIVSLSELLGKCELRRVHDLKTEKILQILLKDSLN